jgi:cellulose biosynthesis protein BcsQ
MDRLKGQGIQKLYFFETFIPENITLGEAPMQAKPINLYDSSTAAAAFENLAKELLSRLQDSKNRRSCVS